MYIQCYLFFDIYMLFLKVPDWKAVKVPSPLGDAHFIKVVN